MFSKTVIEWRSLRIEGLKQGKKQVREVDSASRGKELHPVRREDSDLLGDGVPRSLQQPRFIAFMDSFPYILQRQRSPICQTTCKVMLVIHATRWGLLLLKH